MVKMGCCLCLTIIPACRDSADTYWYWSKFFGTTFTTIFWAKNSCSVF